MEIFIIIIILIVVWFIFKIVIPAFKMTYGNMDEIGESSKYVDANHPIVKNTVAMSRLQYVIKKRIGVSGDNLVDASASVDQFNG